MGITRSVLIVKMRKLRDRIDLLERVWEIKRNWVIRMDEDLTIKERRAKWKLVERARSERAKGKVVVTMNRRIWIDERVDAWGWDMKRNGWYKEAEGTGGESDE